MALISQRTDLTEKKIINTKFITHFQIEMGAVKMEFLP